MNSAYNRQYSSEKLVNIVWIGLLVLTYFSYLIAEGHFSPELLTPVILLTAAIKSILIAAIFMELRYLRGYLLLFWIFFFSGLSWGLYYLFSF